MKRLNEMSREELIALTDEQIETLIDLECAYCGAPLSIAKPMYATVPELPEEDVTYWQVFDFKFLDKTEAAEFADYINSLKSRCTTDYDYSIPGYGRYNRIVDDRKKLDPAIVEEARSYSEIRYSELKELIRQRATAEEENKKLMSEFNEKQKKRFEVVNKVNSAINSARISFASDRERARLYMRYLTLANGNADVAKTFYKDRYGCDITDTILQLAAEEVK